MSNDKPTASLRGRNAVITGASSGIGRAIAEQLGPTLSYVGLVGRRTELLQELKASIDGQGGRAVVLEADLSDPSNAPRVVDAFVQNASRLDILINAAGQNALATVEQAESHEWRRMVEVNLISLAELTRAALPHLRASATATGTADVVNISSINAASAMPATSIYGATKAAVDSFTEAARLEMESAGVRLSTVRPGFTTTELVMSTRPEILEAMSASFQPTGALEPAVIAEWVEHMITAPPGVSVREVCLLPMPQPQPA